MSIVDIAIQYLMYDGLCHALRAMGYYLCLMFYLLCIMFLYFCARGASIYTTKKR